MIKINLTPVEELENPYWWIPDLSVLLVILLLSLGGVYIYVSSVEAEIAALEADKNRMAAETQALASEVERYNSLNQKIELLESKKFSLKRITESKLVRFLPIILLENIQNLKPSGVWLTALAFIDKKADGQQAPPPDMNQPMAANGAAPGAPQAAIPLDGAGAEYPFVIEISGSATSNVQIAEFMMALKTTQNQAYEKSDLRTQLFFSDVALNFSQVSTQKMDGKSSDYVNFKLQLNSRERTGRDTDSTGKFSQFIDDFRRNGQASMN
ncbi:PilN domain-containing protein [Oligoflexus tunisiensis]|uniref:PilN domain-containing protein n=1 Tax=Oligoflexus tunisiensis TaxID=708132 RepID=UPI00114D2F4A|nr:PilN domain-containing protein [Oligoflexus tunisiensis]